MQKYQSIIVALCFAVSGLAFAQAEIPLPQNFPAFSVTTPGSGIYYFSNYTLDPIYLVPSFLVAMDGKQIVRFCRKLPRSATDFKQQPNGCYTYFDVAAGKYFMLDNNYRLLDSFYTQGFPTNDHELRILPNGNALLLGDDYRVIDMGRIYPNGNPRATVVGAVIQELDREKKPVFTWNSFDHIPITDAADDINLLSSYIDYIHSNALDIDYDGNILLCSRNTDEITKIDRKTGSIIWRWGGKRSQFERLGETEPFSHQHSARRLPNGNILLFDNGTTKNEKYSRAVEYQIDETAKTYKEVWEYRHDPDIYSVAMGHAQRLKNGNTLVSWGFNVTGDGRLSGIAATEVTPKGNIVFEFTMPLGQYSYRVEKLDVLPVDGALSETEAAAATSGGKLSVYPNPVSTAASLRFTAADAGRVQLTVYDVLGREVSAVEGMYDAGEHTVTLNTAGFSPGTYLVRFLSGHASGFRKFVVVK